MCSRLFLSPRRAAPGMVYNSAIMQTRTIARSAQRPATVGERMTERARSLSTWYGESSKFNLWQGNFSAKVLPVQEKCLPLPTLTNRESIHAVGTIGHLSSNRCLGNFYALTLYRIGGCRSVNQFCPTGEVTICKQRDVQPPFSVSAPGGSRYAYKSCNMQTNATIGRSAAPTADIKAWLAGKAQSLSGWYNSRSEFYSRLAGFDVTWKTAVRVNLFTVLVCVTAIVAMQQPVVSIVSAACSAWVVYRLNADEKKGGEQ